MNIVASDLDRTLLPNGKYEYDGSMSIFRRIIRNERPILIYATGRPLQLVQKAIVQYQLPVPDYIIAEVGSRIYYRDYNTFRENKDWLRIIKSVTKHWNLGKFKEHLSNLKGLRLQEADYQNQFKLSYYVENQKESGSSTKKRVQQIINSLCKDAIVVYSVNEQENIGYLDILPKYTTKLGAMEYLREGLGIKKENVVYCGDSGNDLLPLTFGYKSVVVKNATPHLKQFINERLAQNNLCESIYIAKGYKSLNGNYVSGTIEGLIKFGVVSPSYI